MKTKISLPLPHTLEPYAAVVLFHRFKSAQGQQSARPVIPRVFLGELARQTGLSFDDIVPWAPLFQLGTTKEALRFTEVLGNKIGHDVPSALLRGYMEHNGFRSVTEQERSTTIYSLALFVSGAEIFEYEDFDQIRDLVKSFYDGNPEEN